jgi:hypothetical protein
MIGVLTLSPDWKTLVAAIVPALRTLLAQSSFANGTVFDVVVPLPNCDRIPLQNLNLNFVLVHYKLSLSSIYKESKNYKEKFIIKWTKWILLILTNPMKNTIKIEGALKTNRI